LAGKSKARQPKKVSRLICDQIGSREVVQFLIDLKAKRPVDVFCLCGNHEDLLHHLDDPRQIASWLANGGDTTLRSYGMASPDELPIDHLKWLLDLPTSFDDGQRLFVHAGIRPGIPLDQQTRRDLLWIREPFLTSGADHGRLIVHGHSPTGDFKPELRRNRVNIDTGVVFGGPLPSRA
jgi:serine/threonine protein phosphatase 1